MRPLLPRTLPFGGWVLPSRSGPIGVLSPPVWRVCVCVCVRVLVRLCCVLACVRVPRARFVPSCRWHVYTESQSLGGEAMCVAFRATTQGARKSLRRCFSVKPNRSEKGYASLLYLSR